ncbi:unnamed protein product [Lepeophtheirus salmonis]|uniref:(salmon louse) hypothetical protein n=1 Tax=Lepeophtheirus salmonis TaxID=72036 RepID=A0A7R8D5F9_LEPSM|nr:unnamed protein product [Lepeophtheirus salmonis]CAF3034033.1 unnamed protein product [Lepeophtheirus salmonis]
MPRSGGSSSKSTFHGMDNTFMSRNKSSNTDNQYYQDVVKKVERQRCIQEFENGNEKRMLNRKTHGRNEESHTKSAYYSGSSKYTSRPPTGNDRLEKYDFIKSYRDRTDESEKWSNFKSEVEERKTREEMEKKKTLEESRYQQLENDSILLREERTKELEKKLPNDWDYQIQLKNHVSQTTDLESEKEATAQRLLAEEKVIQDDDTLTDMKHKSRILAQNSLAEHHERKFQEDIERNEESQEDAIEASKVTAHENFVDEEMQRNGILKAQGYQNRNKEMMSHVNPTEKCKISEGYDNNTSSKYKEEEQTFLRERKKNENERILGYRDNLAAIEKRRQLESGVLADLLHGQSSNSNPSNVKRKDHSSSSAQMNELLRNQIHERRQQVKEIKMKRQEEEEARLETEALYKASELAQKERRVKEQNTYREFLQMQMEEKRNISSKREAEDRDFYKLNEREEADNERDERGRVSEMLQAH